MSKKQITVVVNNCNVTIKKLEVANRRETLL